MNGLEDVVIPIMGMISVFFVPGAVLVVLLVLQYKQRGEREVTYRLAIEKGLDPKELIPPSKSADLRLIGLIFLLVGLALIPGLYALVRWKLALFGLVPVAIGAAYLIAHRLRQGDKVPATGMP